MSPAYFFSLKYSKSRQTGSGHAADSKMHNKIQVFILILCAKYQEAGLSGSREKSDRNYLVRKFAYVHSIESHVKQEVDMRQIQNCVTRYSSPYWCSVPNIRKLASVVPEKNVTKIILWANLSLCPQYWNSRLWCLVIYVSIDKCFVSSKNGKKRNTICNFDFDSTQWPETLVLIACGHNIS